MSLYIHTPWCEQKCHYCDFNSHTLKAAIDETAYLSALIQDLDADLAEFGDGISERTIDSIFIGGGTPSLLSGRFYYQLMQALRSRLNFASDIEITIEANPGSAEANKFAAYRESGINRISLGVQSFDNQLLQDIGRIHSNSEALNAVAMAISAGFERINLDIMFGLPKQNLNQALAELDQAISLNTDHLSWYQLTIEPNTLFYTQRPAHIINDDHLAECYEQGQRLLKANDFDQYEVSAYSRGIQARCTHNMAYWQYHDYLGIGAGAHSKISTIEGDVMRLIKAKQPKQYVQSNGFARINEHTVKHTDMAFEYLLNRLRLFTPIDLKQFTTHTGLPTETISHHFERWQSLQLFQRSDSSDEIPVFCHTAKGRLFIDEMLNQLL